MIKNNILLKFSNLLFVLSFAYLFIQVITMVSKIYSWIKYINITLFGMFLGVSRELSEILYIPLWGFTIAFSIIFFNYWLNE